MNIYENYFPYLIMINMFYCGSIVTDFTKKIKLIMIVLGSLFIYCLYNIHLSQEIMSTKNRRINRLWGDFKRIKSCIFNDK